MPPPEADPARLTLGQRLRRRRWQELRVFQATLARALGLSPPQLSEIERGTAGTTERTLAKLAVALGLGFAELRDQARREGKLDPVRGRLAGDRLPAVPPAASLPRVPRRPRPAPAKRWLTAREAAAVLGLGARTVTRLARRGTLAPARLVPKSRRGQRHWLVAAAAVAAYESPNEGRRWPRRAAPAPPGHCSLADAAAAVGIPLATFHRRIEAWGLVTRREGRRRWVPADQVALARRRRAEDGP